MTSEIKASCQTPASWDEKLGPALVGKWIKIEDGILKSFRVDSEPITNCSKFSNSHTVGSDNFRAHLLALKAAPDVPWSFIEHYKDKKHIHQLVVEPMNIGQY